MSTRPGFGDIYRYSLCLVRMKKGFHHNTGIRMCEDLISVVNGHPNIHQESVEIHYHRVVFDETEHKLCDLMTVGDGL